jgi:hypothetical protein
VSFPLFFISLLLFDFITLLPNPLLLHVFYLLSNASQQTSPLSLVRSVWCTARKNKVQGKGKRPFEIDVLRRTEGIGTTRKMHGREDEKLQA